MNSSSVKPTRKQNLEFFEIKDFFFFWLPGWTRLGTLVSNRSILYYKECYGSIIKYQEPWLYFIHFQAIKSYRCNFDILSIEIPFSFSIISMAVKNSLPSSSLVFWGFAFFLGITGSSPRGQSPRGAPREMIHNTIVLQLSPIFSHRGGPERFPF